MKTLRTASPLAGTLPITPAFADYLNGPDPCAQGAANAAHTPQDPNHALGRSGFDTRMTSRAGCCPSSCSPIRTEAATSCAAARSAGCAGKPSIPARPSSTASRPARWTADATLRLVARQDRVATAFTRGTEDQTPGFGTLDLGTAWNYAKGRSLRIALKNPADKTCREHLAVGVPGREIDAPGRNLQLIWQGRFSR